MSVMKTGAEVRVQVQIRSNVTLFMLFLNPTL